MNMDNISFCFNFFKINMDMCTLLMCFYIQVQKRSWHILTIWTILLSVYPLFQDQMDTFFYFHRDCTQVHQAVLTHFHEEGQYLSLFFHFIKIKMDMWTLSCCTLSVLESIWAVLTHSTLKYSTMSALSSISSNLQRFDTLLDQHVPCNLNVNITFKSWTWTKDTPSLWQWSWHICASINVWNSQWYVITVWWL